MNERVKELAEQANNKADEIILSDKVLKNNEDWFIVFKQQFAELIVKQCGYYADIFDSLGCPGDMDPTETKPSDFIKRQFGIEDV